MPSRSPSIPSPPPLLIESGNRRGGIVTEARNGTVIVNVKRRPSSGSERKCRKQPKKRENKPGEKFRPNFDWDGTEDTSHDMNPLYQNNHEAQLNCFFPVVSYATGALPFVFSNSRAGNFIFELNNLTKPIWQFGNDK
ncbi:hypothetical protein ACFX15_044404 [Malus domestica]